MVLIAVFLGWTATEQTGFWRIAGSERERDDGWVSGGFEVAFGLSSAGLLFLFACLVGLVVVLVFLLAR